MILLDTSVLIEMFCMKNKSVTFFYQLSKSHKDFCISVITHFEIFRGSDDFQDFFWTKFFENVKIIPFDLISSNAAIILYKQLKAQKKTIDLADLLIAATALAHNLPLATLNIKDFKKIPNLHIHAPMRKT